MNDDVIRSLRSITNMETEEPCEQVEKLLWDIQELTTKNRKLEDGIKELNSSLYISQFLADYIIVHKFNPTHSTYLKILRNYSAT